MSCLGSAAAQTLADAIHERPFRKSELIQVEGAVADRIAIIKVGSVKAMRKGTGASERPVALAGRGQLVGAYGLLGQRNQLSAKALTAGRLCEISIADLYRLGVIDRTFLACVYTLISKSFGHLADWAHIMRVRSIQQQLLSALQLIGKDQGTQLIRLPSHVALAELLSTTRESVARHLRLLEQQGLLIRRDRWHCQLTTTLSADAGPHG